MKIRPLHDRVIVKRLEEEKTSAGGIIIPDTAAEKPVQGKIVAVGKGKILGAGGEPSPLSIDSGLRGGRPGLRLTGVTTISCSSGVLSASLISVSPFDCSFASASMLLARCSSFGSCLLVRPSTSSAV